MAFDGFTLKSVVQELQNSLIGGKVTKIYQPNIEEIILGVYSHGKNYALTCNVSFSSYSLHLTTKSKPNPLTAPNFCMLLRKYLIGYKVKAISMTGLERIAIIELEGYNELNDFVTLKLIVELMGKHSNIILINQDNIIIDSLKHLHTFDGSYRNIVPGAIYQFPESNKLNAEEIKRIVSKNDFSLDDIKGDSPLKVNFFLDDFYYTKEQAQEFKQYRDSILAFIMKKLKKISKKLDTVNDKINECSKMDEYKLYGELLTSNLYKINNIHIDHIVLENYYKQNEPIEIPLDVSLSPADNAKKYFKKYHKLKNTIDIVSEQKIELEKEINYLESIVYELQVAQTTQDVDNIYKEMEDANLFSRKTQAKSGSKEYRIKNSNSRIKNGKSNNIKSNSSSKIKDFLSYQIDGFTVLVGKNNQENDLLSLKIAKENDLWFHVKDMQGSHVVLTVQAKEPSQEVINQVAAIAAYYSRAKQSSNVPVDYTLAKYVKKPTKARPGMVIYTNQKTVNVQPKL